MGCLENGSGFMYLEVVLFFFGFGGGFGREVVRYCFGLIARDKLGFWCCVFVLILFCILVLVGGGEGLVEGFLYRFGVLYLILG